MLDLINFNERLRDLGQLCDILMHDLKSSRGLSQELVTTLKIMIRILLTDIEIGIWAILWEVRAIWGDVWAIL